MLRHPRLSVAPKLAVLAVSLTLYLLGASAAEPATARAGRSATLTSQAIQLAEEHKKEGTLNPAAERAAADAQAALAALGQ